MAASLTLDELAGFLAHQRAVRTFTREPVDDAVVEQILAAATRAPSARNLQPWRFIVIRERGTKEALGAIFDDLGRRLYGAAAPDRTPWAEVPVLVAVCSEYVFGTSASGMAALGASIYPAVQNLLLAVQAAGLGGVLTTRWKEREADVRPILGLPGEVAVHAIIPIGHPATPAGRNRRTPAAEVTFRERFGAPWAS
jgi:nitroreductase